MIRQLYIDGTEAYTGKAKAHADNSKTKVRKRKLKNVHGIHMNIAGKPNIGIKNYKPENNN